MTIERQDVFIRGSTGHKVRASGTPVITPLGRLLVLAERLRSLTMELRLHRASRKTR